MQYNMDKMDMMTGTKYVEDFNIQYAFTYIFILKIDSI